MRLLLATHNYRLAADLVSAYADVNIVAVSASYAEAIEAAEEAARRGLPIDAAIIDERLDAARDIDLEIELGTAISRIRAAAPASRVIVSTPSVAPIPEATDQGAELFVEHDPERVAANLAAKLSLLVKSDAATLIAVVGLEGGAGRSSVAANLASAIGEMLPKRADAGVLLWEGDLKHATYAYTVGSFDPSLTESGRRTIRRLINSDLSSASITEIKQAIIAKERISHLGYDLLLAPYGIREVVGMYQSYTDLHELGAQLRTILELCRRSYSAVVIDTGTDFISDPMPALALSSADAIVVVASPSAGGLSNVRNMQEVLSDLHAVPRSFLVLNRTGGRTADGDKYQRLIEEEGRNGLAVTARVPEGNDNPRVWNDLAVRLMPSLARK